MNSARHSRLEIVPALAYGNTVVFKPANLVPGPAHARPEIIVRPAFPRACSISPWGGFGGR